MCIPTCTTYVLHKRKYWVKNDIYSELISTIRKHDTRDTEHRKYISHREKQLSTVGSAAGKISTKMCQAYYAIRKKTDDKPDVVFKTYFIQIKIFWKEINHI